MPSILIFYWPVIETFNPVMKEFYYSESQGLPIINENVYIVNSISELPDDERVCRSVGYIFCNNCNDILI